MNKASIIVPVYQVEPYLCRCIDSILVQTLSSNRNKKMHKEIV